MVRTPCCSKVGLHKGPWTSIEDTLLTRYIETHGEGNWKNLPGKAGLLRCGKSCRMRWVNYLRPDIKRGNIGPEEEDLIIRLHALLGNRWSLIARRLPGRTDNEIKNFWNIHLSKRLKMQGVEVKEGSSRFTSKQSTSSETKDISRTTNNNKNSKNKMKVSTKIKIHTPKPTRLVSVLRNPNYRFEKSVQGVANGSTIYEGDLEHFLDQCDIPPQGDMLERLFEEYSHILNSGIDQFGMDCSSELMML